MIKRSIKIMMLILISIIIEVNITYSQSIDTTSTVTIFALGDINLGRTVGQKILKGEIDYPFEYFNEMRDSNDIVFANLECQISDQNGETQHPKYNLIFCAPPDASKSLKNARINIVSIANNHMFDYGLNGLKETIKFLNEDSIKYIGAIYNKDDKFEPIVINQNGINIGFLAYTQIVNMKRGVESGQIAMFDSAKVKRDIDTLKSKVDYLIVSYHGGSEYTDTPPLLAKKHMEYFAKCGANIVLGHHPHVPQGITEVDGCIIFYSLGNAIFYQPQKYWTQRSFAVRIMFSKENIESIQIVPFRAGYQIKSDLSEDEQVELIDRINKLSKLKILQNERGYFVQLNNKSK